ELARRLAIGADRILELEQRLRVDDAVVVCALVAELQGAASLRFGLLGERNGGRTVRHCGEAPDHVMRNSAAHGYGASLVDYEAMFLGALGRGGHDGLVAGGLVAGLGLLEPACRHDIKADLAARTDDERAAGRRPNGRLPPLAPRPPPPHLPR